MCSWQLPIDLLTMFTQPTVSVHAAEDTPGAYSRVTKRALKQLVQWGQAGQKRPSCSSFVFPIKRLAEFASLHIWGLVQREPVRARLQLRALVLALSSHNMAFSVPVLTQPLPSSSHCPWRTARRMEDLVLAAEVGGLSAALSLRLLLFGWAPYLLGAHPGPTYPETFTAAARRL